MARAKKTVVEPTEEVVVATEEVVAEKPVEEVKEEVKKEVKAKAPKASKVEVADTVKKRVFVDEADGY